MTGPEVTPARSALMRAVRQRNTKPEIELRKLLHSRGWRFRLHGKGLPGSPDIVFSKRRKAIFVHGCFWHGHDCSKGRLPKTRREFWAAKMEDNRARDARVVQGLEQEGWGVLTVWQCEMKERDALINTVEDFLGPRSS